jgi:polar amino acid transport system permease protein
MFRRSQLVGKADFKNLEAYVLVAIFYWILTALFTLLQSRLEARLAKGYVRDAVVPSGPAHEHGGAG